MIFDAGLHIAAIAPHSTRNCYKPIICCSDGGITDVIEHEQEALIIPPKDESATIQALKLMLDNPDKVTTMGHNAKHLIESSLTWDVKTKELLNHFETVPTSQ